MRRVSGVPEGRFGWFPGVWPVWASFGGFRVNFRVSGVSFGRFRANFGVSGLVSGVWRVVSGRFWGFPGIG